MGGQPSSPAQTQDPILSPRRAFLGQMRQRLITARASSQRGNPWVLPLICAHPSPAPPPCSIGSLASSSTLAFPSWLEGELALKHHFQVKVPFVAEIPLVLSSPASGPRLPVAAWFGCSSSSHPTQGVGGTSLDAPGKPPTERP